MSIRHALSIRRSVPAAALFIVANLFVQLSPAHAQKPPIRFAVEVPRTPQEMEIFKLEPTRPPIEFLNEKLEIAKLPPLNLEQKAYIVRGTIGQQDRDRVRAFVDPESGDAHFTPNFAELVQSRMPEKALPLERAQSIAKSVLSDERFIPKDATELRLAEPIAIMGATAQERAPEKPSEPVVVLTIVPAFRYAAGFRVYGRGSHAVVSLGNSGAIVGLLRRWRTASPGERVRVSITPEKVRENIERRLRPIAETKDTRVTVDKISVAYYDANAKYLQPVYYFQATVKSANERISDTMVAGYVPIAKELEPIPDLAVRPKGPTPEAPKQVTSPSPDRKAPAGDPSDISLGEYANRNWPHDSAYLSMSNSFLSGLTFLDSFFPGLTPPVVRTQWYDAYPWEVVGPSSRYYMNAVNVAYTVPHGDWLINTTLSNNADTWYVPNIGTGGNPGFGAASGGVLATWVIMSCEVIPSMYDRQNESGGTGNPYKAFDAWWPVFQGLHNVIGFRTIMFYPDDGLQWGFGFDASVGGDLNAAWFQEVAAYDGDDGTYASQHLKGAPQVHYDRASTMIDARDLGQSIYNVRAQSASTTLWNFWMNN
ncbi:MAG TPA: hypothetical protein VLX32_07730 [Candidatus Acidoferrum sp.]|nr:hypothetical protein [Candidatus Acidoferrum sp.]